MRSFFSKLSHTFAAGCFGGLVNSLVVWAFGHYHLTYLLGVKLSPSFSLAWLYPRVVWGGIWGFLFLLPLRSGSAVKNGLLLSLGPTLVQLFVLFPYKTHKGLMGMDLGTLTPLTDLGTLTPLTFLIFNAFWGVATALWLKAARG
jgi:hypothetical protein